MDAGDPLVLTTEGGYDDAELTENQRRWARALSDRMVVVPTLKDDGTATGIYEVFTATKSAYVADLAEPACCCPDFVFNRVAGGCKHVRRVRVLAETVADFPTRGDDASGYVETLEGVLETLAARRDLLATQVFAGDDEHDAIAVSPDGDLMADYRTTDWFVEQVGEHDTLAE